ncbi:hypothetical protein DH2020_019502 [Rehmannia glutinosa]|uniref:Uncharacterized protein n=1 Tax=Rehmannia glutinosa TaxID=99300 RepID=A0ABR0WRB0_REHGL
MPGNELGDGVHNFFAQDNSLQGQHHSQVVEGNWPSVLNEQPNSNGFMYGNQFHLSRQNEANFLAVDSDSDQRHLITSRGLSIRDLQGSGADHQAKASVRVETSVSPVSFDLFGGQQMNHNQSNVPQSLQRQQSGINDMQHLQQQLIFRKMEELQRQQQLQQLDLRQHNFINQVPSFAKQTSASQSTLLNGTPNSDTVQNPWTAELGTNWLNRVSPSMQGSPSGLGFPPNLGQTQQLVDLVPQQVDQSLYGVPISSSRGLPANHYNQMVAARSSMPQMSISSNFHQGNQHNLLPDQDFLGRQELAGRPEASHEKPTKQVASPQNEVPLDPTEEKILFGSDDNIWAAFAKEPHVSGEADNSFNNGGLSNGLPSIQSGSWSALMQSAVAETSSNDMAPQEEWSALSAGSFPLSDDVNANNAMGSNQLGQKFQNGPGQRLPTEMSKSFPVFGGSWQVSSEGDARRSCPWKFFMEVKFGPSSAIELGHVNSRVGNSQASQGSLSLKDAGISGESSPFVHSNYLLNQWKNAHPPVRSKEGESLGRLPHQANNLNQVLNSMNSHEKDEVARHEMENWDGKENSNDSHRSNLSQHTSGGFREGGLSDVNESQSLVIGKQKSTNQLSRKVSAPRKFQYHPMGNVDEDVEPTYGLKQHTRVQAMSQQNAHFGHVPRNSTVMEKGLSSELQRDAKGPDEEPSRGNLSGPAPNLPVPFSGPIDTYTSNKTSSSSQNMLDLLHKVDQSRNHGAMMQFSSSECNASSQLPKQKILMGNDAVEMGDKGPQMVASHSVQSLPSVEETQVEFQPNKSGNPGHGGNDDSMYKMPGNFTSAFGSGVPYSRSNVQNQQLPRICEAPLPDASGSFQQDNLASSGNMSQQSGPNDVQERVLAAAIPTKDGERSSQHFAMPGISRRGDSAQVLHNMWTNVPTHQHNIRVQYQQVPSHIPESPQPHIVESSSAPLMEGNVNSQGAVDGEVQRLKENSGQRIPSVNTDPIRKMKNSLGKSSAMKNRMDDSPAYSASAQNDIEAFGRSLKPNSSAHQSYSLLTHMEASKDAEIDSSNRASKRMKGPENIAEVYQAALKARQQNVHSAAVGDSLGSSTGVLSEDSKMLGYSRPADIMQRNTSHQGNIASQDTLGLGRDPQVSPQMAPSWFNQYGTLKNGQMLQIYEARNVTPSRPGEPPFTPAKSSSGFDMLNSEEKGSAASTDECQTDNSDQNPTPSLVANGHLPSQSSQLNVTGQHLVSLRPEKRKSATSEFHPWHKEISEGSQDLWTLSMTELDWNKAANRLTEKVVDDAELMEDGPPVLRSKRRLVLTTHLMQQLLRPAPAAILSTDASTSLRVWLILSIAKGKSADRSGGRCYGKVTEELMGSARKLENDFLRLDKSASILDLRVECQDLEKFSVINRFARFHGRGQTDNAETTSTDVTASTQKPIPQRYVTAFPMPRNLPDRVQCLSL